VGHVATWRSRGWPQQATAMVSRGSAGSSFRFDDIPPLRARACPLRAQRSPASRSLTHPSGARKGCTRASRGPPI
jgi:hypothetical protein